MTPDKTPTDAELWQLHMQLPGQHKDPIDFARAVLAKWGSPVVAGEPYAYAVYFPDQPCEELVHELDDLTEDLTNREHTITKLYDTPQPTQAQAGAVPLTAKQMESGREAIFSTGNPYCPCDSKTFRKVAEWVERHHGIKEGGQHGIE